MSNPLLARFAGEPVLAAERRDRFEACLDAVMTIEHGPAMLREGASADDGYWPEPSSWKAVYRPYVVVDGVLQIPVKGVLLHDFSYAVGGWATGYVYIRRAFERGMADDGVKGIALLCDSPGGEVAGCFDLVDAMHAGKAGKPVWAFAHESAYSAAYAVASVADKIWVSRTGGVGSIGVVTMHVDRSAALEKAGLKITFVHAGKHKVDGNSTEPLADDVRARMQVRIDGLNDVFVATVHRNRPALSERAIRATQALCFTADEATKNGLADAIGSLDDAVSAFVADLNPPDQGDEEMADQKSAPTADAAALAAARAEGRAEGHAAGLVEGKASRDQDVTSAKAEGRTEERTRIKGILGSDQAKGREKSAAHLALNTDLDLAMAEGALSGMEKSSSLDSRMSNRQALDLDPDQPTGGKQTDAAAWDDVVATLNAEAGFGKKR